jgi:hypothetical protein
MRYIPEMSMAAAAVYFSLPWRQRQLPKKENFKNS